MELEHACYQVFELFSEEAWLVSLDVEFPEEVSPVCCQQLIERVRGICLCEGWMLGIQDEEDHTECEQINNMALIWLTIQDFWCHVRSGADHRVVEP